MTDQPHGQQPYGQQPYGQQPYGQQPYYGQPPMPGGYGSPAPVQSTNTMAILSLVCAFVFAPLGLIFGFVARSQIKRSGEGGSGLATAGIIVSAVQVLIGIVVLTMFIGLASSIDTTLPVAVPVR